MPRHFDLIVFDWDGTLFDSTAVIARSIQAAVRDLGGTIPSDQLASHVIGLDLSQALAKVAPDIAPEHHRELTQRYRHHYLAKQDELFLFTGVPELLHELLQGGSLLAVATGKSRRGLDAVLSSSNLGQVFAATRTADQTAGKPHPRMLLELMDELGAAAERTLMIGDTTHDLQMANNAGCASVAVSYGAHAPSELLALHPSFIASSVDQLGRWIRQRT